MSIMSKPDYKIFASEARDGEVIAFPDVLRGWGETINKTEKIPPMEWFNSLAMRQDEWLMYLTQRGIAQWDSAVDYPKDAMIQHSGKYYVSLRNNNGQNPAQSSESWSELKKWLGIDGKVNTTDIAQSTGQSNVKVMSQKAVTDAISNSSVDVVQQSGQSNKSVMSQKAVSDRLFSDGQSYSNVKSSRQLGVTYTNLGSKAIFVIVSGTGWSDRYSGFNAFVGDTLITTSTVYGAGSRPNVSFIVPSGASYRVSRSSTSENISVENWFELS